MSPANVHSFPCLRSELLGLLRRHVPRPRAHGQRLDWARDTWVEMEAPGTVLQ